MAEPFCYGPKSASVRGVRMPCKLPPVREYHNRSRMCPGCVNNLGGICAYDMDLEEEEAGVLPGEYCNWERCLCYESCDQHENEHT